MCMMPVFINIFQIYAMCNLHDVSWGNRPASTGQEAFSNQRKEQAKAEESYKVFRTKFVIGWMAANVGFYICISLLLNSGSIKDKTYRDSDSGFLTVFSVYLGALAVFRIFVATIYIIKWKCRYNFCKTFEVHSSTVNLKLIKERSVNGESSEDEAVQMEIDKIVHENKNELER